MADYCLDSNVVSDILRDDPKVMPRLKEVLNNGDKLYISSIVYYEVVRGLKAAGKTRMLKNFRDFYNTVRHLDLDMNAIDKAVEIYLQLRNGQLIEDNDIYIAAMAVVNGCTLVRVEGLNFVNWRD